VCYTIRSARRGEKGTSDVSTDIARTMLGVGVCVCMRMRVTVCHFPQPTFQAMTSRHDDDRYRADETKSAGAYVSCHPSSSGRTPSLRPGLCLSPSATPVLGRRPSTSHSMQSHIIHLTSYDIAHASDEYACRGDIPPPTHFPARESRSGAAGEIEIRDRG
jgi:hypothetical protein